MKILAFNGSPRTNGSTSKIIDAICLGAAEKGHSYKTVNLYQLKFSGCRGCRACSEGKVEYCVLNDEFSELIPDIIAADCLVIGSPVYFGHITGHTKNLVDRFFTFVETGFKIRHINDKKVITVLTSGAPTDYFKSISDDYMKQWLGKFMQMNIVDQIVQGDQMDDNSLPAETLKRASLIGASIFD